MKQAVSKRKRPGINPDELFSILTDIWNELPNALFYKLSDSIISRFKKVTKLKGKSTKY